VRTRTCTASHIGDREENQDRVAVEDQSGWTLLVVADGMGGHEEGARAAIAAVETTLDTFRGWATGDCDPADYFHSLADNAHKAVYALGDGMHVEERPRTTLVTALVGDGKVWFGHIGDSRAYLLRSAGTVHRTRDHSHVEQLIQAGEWPEAERHLHPLRNLVDRCLGGEPQDVSLDTSGGLPLVPGDVVLLCSDGFWEGLNFAEVSRQLSDAADLDAALDLLVNDARQYGRPHADNATAAVLRVEQ
jgi:PPM family protein phosphatase